MLPDESSSFKVNQPSDNHKVIGNGNVMQVTGFLRLMSSPIRVVYVSSYIPRKCGIATFTKYLTNGINLLNPLKPAQIIALDNSTSESINYPKEVIFRIKDNDFADYKKAAQIINSRKSIELVSLQHEFGIYGENYGEKVINFIKLIKKPVITTLHSLRTDYEEERKEIIRQIYENSTYVVVMLDTVSEKLYQIIGKSPDKAVVIPHGVLDYPMLEDASFKKKLRLKSKIVMSSINLLSTQKGIEYAINAVPKIVKEIPNFVYFIIGESHPSHLLKNKSDLYRIKLKRLVKALGVEKNVRFINRYVTTSEQKNYIGASDFYVTPYLDPQQASSGALAFAIGAGKVCISTPYPYAKEMLKSGRGILVPFRNSSAIARAIISVVGNPMKMHWYKQQSYNKGRLMTWNNVGHQYYHLFNIATNKTE